MQELGEMLRAARQEKGLTLADAEEATRIRQRYLEALEYGDERTLPARVYVEGFLRSYAAYLGLPPLAVLDKYRAAGSRAGPAPTAAIQPVRDVRMPAIFSWRRVVLLGALLAIVVLVAAVLFLPPGHALSPWLPSWPPAWWPAAPPATETPLAGAPDGASDGTPGPGPVDETTPPAEPEATPEPTAEPTPAPVPAVTVEVEVLTASWLRVTVDDVLAFEGTLEAGSRQYWTGTRSVAIRSGNAAGTLVTVDGAAKGPLGAPGEVVDVAWTTQ